MGSVPRSAWRRHNPHPTAITQNPWKLFPELKNRYSDFLRVVRVPLSPKAVPTSFLGAIAQLFFWREKSVPGRRIKYPIGYLKYPKSPNPTLQPCWVHPTKSQNSLQEVDWQLIPTPHRRLISAIFGYFPICRADWREMGRKMSDFFLKPLWEPDLGWMYGMR